MTSTNACRNLADASPAELKSFLASFDTVLCDCDGVVYRGGKALPGSPDMLAKFKDLGKKVIYVTNNSNRTRQGYVEKFASIGITAELVI